MKALLLAGGTGSRLRPLTSTSAKQLLPVANRPILFYGLEAIRAAGITDVGVIVGETGAEVRAALGDGSRFGVSLTFIEQDAPRGLAHAVLIAEEFIGQDPFLMFLGDNLVRAGVTGCVEAFRQRAPSALLLLSRVPDPQRFGVVVLQEGRIVRLVEKPPVPPSDLALVGVYLFDHQIFAAVKAITPSWRGELEITDAIQWLVDQGQRVESVMVEGWWKDTGKPEDLIDANRLLLETIEPRLEGDVSADSRIVGRVVIEPGARIRSSVIRGPAIIGAGAEVTDSYVGPNTSIGRAVVLRGVEMENSVVMDGSVIEHVGDRIDASLIGRNVTIAGVQSRPQGLHLVLGDNSRVWTPQQRG